MKIGILSDTHGYWDDRYSLYFKDCDEIWHAGDIGGLDIAVRLAAIAPLRAVSGNIDYGEVRRQYPGLLIFTAGSVKVLLTHIGGYPPRWSPGMRKLIADNGIGLVVDGHSHILRVMYDEALEALLVNPGAAGRQGWHKVRTLVTLHIDGAEIHDCKVYELSDTGEIKK